MAYEIEISAEAKEHLRAIYQWTAESLSREQARKRVGDLETSILSLGELPARCPLALESRAANAEIRQLIQGKGNNCYRILFQIEGDKVFVIAVRHARRAPLE